MQQIKWTDRKFMFGYDKSYVPLFIERLRGTAPRLEELLKGVDEDKASIGVGGAWSIKEHAGHLADIEKLHEGRVDDFMEGFSTLRAADMSNRDTMEANHNAIHKHDLLSAFRETRNRFLKRIELLDEVYFERKALHPRLRQMITLTDMLFFVAEHDTHHLARIAELAK